MCGQASSDAEGNANVLLKNQMSGAVELLGTSEVEVVRGGMQLRIRTPVRSNAVVAVVFFVFFDMVSSC